MCIINCPLKKYIYTLKLYNHPAETHRLLKFLFHIMGRLVPAHKDIARGFAYQKRDFLTHLISYILLYYLGIINSET